MHDELVYRVEFESNTPDLSGFHDATLRDIRAVASTDSEQNILRSLISDGWPNDKAAVPELAQPYWSVRHELTTHDGLLFKRDVSSSLLVFAKASYTNSMPPTMALSLLFAMPKTVSSGQASDHGHVPILRYLCSTCASTP